MTRKNEEILKRRRTIVPALVSVLTALLLSGACSVSCAFAEEARVCQDDLTRFCKEVRPGGGRILACLKSHEAELDPACRDKFQALVKRLEEAKRTCADDIEKFCKGIEQGEGRIAGCLEKHAGDLSPACAEKLDWVKAKMGGK